MKHVGDWLQAIIHHKTLLYGALGITGIAIGMQTIMPTKALQSINLLAGSWDSMPASRKTAEGLLVMPQKLKIVKQDGSGGQSNPPVNLLGDRLEAKGDFTLTAHIKRDHTTANLWFYGQVPLIADEFRIDRASLRIAISDQRLEVTQFGKGQSEPLAKRQFSIQAQQDSRLELTRHNQEFLFKVNGKPVGTMHSDVFDSNQVWFGAQADTKAWQLVNLQANGINGGQLTVTDLSQLHLEQAEQNDSTALQNLAAQKRPGFLLGAAMALAPMASDVAYKRLALGGNFGSMTTENALKWQFIHPEPKVYDFHEADALVRLAQKHNLAVHGHTLVFGEANPAWVTSLASHTEEEKQAVSRIMREHITAVMNHFKGRIASWDVINEPLMDDFDNFDPQVSTGLRQHIWWQALGEDYIDQALRVAHRTDPKAALFINEYGLESDGERWNTFIALLQRLQGRGVPLTGVGFQAHVYERNDQINPKVLRAHIRQLASMNLKVRVSELDVYSDDGESVQAKQYADVLGVCITEPNCVSLTTWGISDRYNFWKDDNQIRQGRDFLWDENMKPRPAVQNIKQLLKK
jgi:endo-1,4-beta-xylanase